MSVCSYLPKRRSSTLIVLFLAQRFRVESTRDPFPNHDRRYVLKLMSPWFINYHPQNLWAKVLVLVLSARSSSTPLFTKNPPSRARVRQMESRGKIALKSCFVWNSEKSNGGCKWLLPNIADMIWGARCRKSMQKQMEQESAFHSVSPDSYIKWRK